MNRKWLCDATMYKLVEGEEVITQRKSGYYSRISVNMEVGELVFKCLRDISSSEE